MKRALVVVAVMVVGGRAAHAQVAARVASADSAIALEVERDNLLPLVEPPTSVVVQPRSDMDRAAPRPADHAGIWRAIDITALAASTAMLACDWGQTHQAARRGWVGQYESNPIMGPTPSTRGVDLYFATAAVANVLIWAVTPSRYRSALPAGVIAYQTDVLVENLGNGSGVCGIGGTPPHPSWKHRPTM